MSNQGGPGHFLDKFSAVDVRRGKRYRDEVLSYHWEYYSALAQQRALILDSLKEALSGKTSPFTFNGWQRVVGGRFMLRPLSSRGSVLNEVGGRFNFGSIEETQFPTFPALYIAQDKATAYKERYGLYKDERKNGLTAEDLAVAGDDPTCFYTVRGKIEQVLDITKTRNILKFVELIKDFKLPKGLAARARGLGQDPPNTVKDIETLRRVLEEPNWRFLPQQFQVPAGSQIFGQIAAISGIEAILYRSRMDRAKSCLAVFTQNFSNSNSRIELCGKLPAELLLCRIDSNTYKESLL